MNIRPRILVVLIAATILAIAVFSMHASTPAKASDGATSTATTTTAATSTTTTTTTTTTEKKKSIGKPVANGNCNTDAGVQECCSAGGCSGKVLSNRDKHNCKVKSRGKSWHNAAGKCSGRL